MKCYITVPKNKKAEEAFDFDQAEGDQLLRLILDETELKSLWSNGVFNAINMVSGSNIDLHESEAITDKDLQHQVIASGIFEGKDFANSGAVAKIKVLFQEAIMRGTGIYFDF